MIDYNYPTILNRQPNKLMCDLLQVLTKCAAVYLKKKKIYLILIIISYFEWMNDSMTHLYRLDLFCDGMHQLFEQISWINDSFRVFVTKK